MFKRFGLCLASLIISSAVCLGNQKSGISRLGWMSGCWVSDDGRMRIEECWMKPAGQSMIGTSRTLAEGKTVFTEFAMIREENGEINYVVSIGLSARPVAFKLIGGSDREAIFENPAHDYPQRIIYRSESADSLFARIEGEQKGVQKATDFRYKRTSCE